MLLRLRHRPDRAEIYWEKWAAAIMGLVAGGFCLGFAVTLYRFSGEAAGAVHGFVLVFCVLFGLAGIVALARLPRQVRRLAQEDGAAHVLIDANGLEVTPTLGAEPRRLVWTRIGSVHLADRFKTVEHGETGYAWRVMLVMPAQEEHEPIGLRARLQSGLLHSGAGRSYFAAGFPRGQAAAVLDALRRHAPRGVVLARHREVVFDRKAKLDRFDGDADGASRAR